MILKFKGREIEVEIEGCIEEPMIARGNYTDGNMENLTDDELDEVYEYAPGEIDQWLMEHMMEMSHAHFAGDR